MKVICSYCLASLDDKAPFENAAITHTICADCEAYFAPQWEGLSLGEYLDREIHEPHWALMRVAMASPADTCIVPMQDVLGLGAEGRMNLPGEGSGNWDWRLPAGALLDPAGERLARLTWLYRRRADQADPKGDQGLPDDYPEATG